jgi:glyoxylase-like metal-dependent hydrolase (beta-lactamase superfamily II)
MILRIRDNVYCITENMGSNNSAIVTPEGVVLVDTPHKPTDALKWREFVETLGPTKYVVISDHHIDHTLTNDFFGGTLISHELTRQKLLTDAPSVGFITKLLGRIDPEGIRYIHGDYRYRIPEITINKDMTLYLGGVEIRVMHMKGHTENSIMVYMPGEKILFTGDNVCENGLPCTDQTCFPEVYETLDYIINEMDVDTIVPGHGDVCTKKEAIRFKGEMKEIVARVNAEIKKGAGKQEISDKLRYDDRIHIDTEKYKGYPAADNEGFQRRSFEHIYDVLKGGA